MTAILTSVDAKQLDERYRVLVDAITDYAIYMIDVGGHVSSWNTGANRFKSYTEQEILGEHFSRFYTSEDREAGRPEIGQGPFCRDNFRGRIGQHRKGERC